MCCPLFNYKKYGLLCMNVDKITGNKERIQWIEQLRGMAILLVIVGHVDFPNKVNGVIYSFHMPLFFIIIGLTMNNQKLSIMNIKE